MKFEQESLRDIFSVKRLVLQLRRHLSPMREVFNVSSQKAPPSWNEPRNIRGIEGRMVQLAREPAAASNLAREPLNRLSGEAGDHQRPT